jgi:hypothetical protein
MMTERFRKIIVHELNRNLQSSEYFNYWKAPLQCIIPHGRLTLNPLVSVNVPGTQEDIPGLVFIEIKIRVCLIGIDRRSG